MLMKAGTYPVQIIEKMKGGEGHFKVEHILSQDQMGQAGRLFGWGTLEPGHSVGWHVHQGDAEACCCISGQGIVVDGEGKEAAFEPGDVNFVPSGFGHEIRNTGNENLVYLVCVLYTEGRIQP